MRTCSIDECGGPHHANGLCQKHAQRARRNGGPLVSRPWVKSVTPLAERLWRRVERRGHTECWPWTGPPNHAGYGVLSRGKRGDGMVLAHRLSYELLVGPIPDGLTIDHLCRNTLCVNPAHLEPVTLAENARRAHAARVA